MGKIRDLTELTTEELAKVLQPDDRSRLRELARSGLTIRPAVTSDSPSRYRHREAPFWSFVLMMLLGALAVAIGMMLGFFNN